MANLSLPLYERNLTPDEVVRLDARRRRGQLFFTICGQTAIITVLLSLWVGQDLTYSPGWERPMTYWALTTGLISFVTFILGMKARRGNHEFTSY
ncbi:hypothetical protein [Terriglobus saanensis]|uniref:Uncharacterized protein n=1 Tax=Terriglobus saanensis (strain ATCC BAA-1853 / DSM 23119 / SP1PR4) TaxID=401053 RepID=E8V861_TERSS|nr:hypothetical protein [Terriglobus saanensis]ADV84043.1 hypothetical protein AciPR4_3288 [Terriglobus saanensis SP1PR4]